MSPLTGSSIPDFVRAHKFAVIHFWASWNLLDVRVRSFLETEIPAEFRERVAFGTLEVDPPENWEICRQHEIRNIPFLAFYRDGSLIATVTGLQWEEILKRIADLFVEG
jgi:thioredoxin-like negative regulator of GroEL